MRLLRDRIVWNNLEEVVPTMDRYGLDKKMRSNQISSYQFKTEAVINKMFRYGSDIF